MDDLLTKETEVESITIRLRSPITMPEKCILKPFYGYRQLYKNLEEAAAWKGMGFDVPDGIATIFTDNEAYVNLKKQVKHL